MNNVNTKMNNFNTKIRVFNNMVLSMVSYVDRSYMGGVIHWWHWKPQLAECDQIKWWKGVYVMQHNYTKATC